MKTVAQRLKEAMEIRGISQAELVEKTGITKGALSSYISGRYIPKQKNIALLSKALDVDEAWLLGSEDVAMKRVSDAERFAAWAEEYNKKHSLPEYTGEERPLIDVYRKLSKLSKKKLQRYAHTLLDLDSQEGAVLFAAHHKDGVDTVSEHDKKIMEDDSEWEE